MASGAPPNKRLKLSAPNSMNLRSCLLGLVIAHTSAVVASAQQPNPPTPGWANPAVFQSHSVRVQTETDIRQHKLLVQTDSAVCDSGAVRVTAQLFADTKGRVRKYSLTGGTDDMFQSVFYYYDDRGVLRVTIAQVGAVNGTEQQTNFYFDDTGVFIAKTNDLISGPGFPAVADSVVRDPETSFRALCRPSSGTGPR